MKLYYLVLLGIFLLGLGYTLGEIDGYNKGYENGKTEILEQF